MYSESEFLCGLSDSNGALSTSRDPDFISNRARIIALLRSEESSLTVDPSPLHESARYLEIRILELESLIGCLQADLPQRPTILDGPRPSYPCRRSLAHLQTSVYERKVYSPPSRTSLGARTGVLLVEEHSDRVSHPMVQHPWWAQVLTSRTPEILQRTLELSCECPLHLELDLYGNGCYDETFVRQVVALIAHNSSRWESVNFTWTPRILPLFSGVYGRLPLLRSLRATFQNV